MQSGAKRNDCDRKGALVYMVTIKCNHFKYTSLTEILDVYNSLVKRIRGADWHDSYAIELDKHYRLHLHGVFKRDRKINLSTYKIPGWNIHFTIFDSYEHAVGYINKQDQHQCLQEQRNIESYSHYYNMFTGIPNKRYQHDVSKRSAVGLK